MISKFLIVMVIILMYLTLGCLFDGISFMVMTLPFVFPIIKGLGFGGIWFGVLMILLIEVGQLTPACGAQSLHHPKHCRERDEL